MCILGFLFFSSTLFLNNHKKNCFLDIYYAYLPFFDRLLFKKHTVRINYRSRARLHIIPDKTHDAFLDCILITDIYD